MKKGVVCSVLNFENGEQLANLNNLRVNVGHFGNSHIFGTLTFLSLLFYFHLQKLEFGAYRNICSWEHWFSGPFNHLVVVVQNKSYKKTLFRLTTKVSPLISWVSIFNIFPCRISSPIHACVRYAEHLENYRDKTHKEATVERDFFHKCTIG